ncbi:unnamed protein product, partial [marine sediment metagenome]
SSSRKFNKDSEMTLVEIHGWVGKQFDLDNPYQHGVAEPTEAVELMSLIIRYGQENYIEGKKQIVNTTT